MGIFRDLLLTVSGEMSYKSNIIFCIFHVFNLNHITFLFLASPLTAILSIFPLFWLLHSQAISPSPFSYCYIYINIHGCEYINIHEYEHTIIKSVSVTICIWFQGWPLCIEQLIMGITMGKMPWFFSSVTVNFLC